MLQGTLALLVLKALVPEPMQGYGITLHIQTILKDVLRVEEGSLYPALHRMAQDGWIKAEWGASENNRRVRFYSLTPVSRKQLAEEEKSWAGLTQAVASVMQHAWIVYCVEKAGVPCPGYHGCVTRFKQANWITSWTRNCDRIWRCVRWTTSRQE